MDAWGSGELAARSWLRFKSKTQGMVDETLGHIYLTPCCVISLQRRN